MGQRKSAKTALRCCSSWSLEPRGLESCQATCCSTICSRVERSGAERRGEERRGEERREERGERRSEERGELKEKKAATHLSEGRPLGNVFEHCLDRLPV